MENLDFNTLESSRSTRAQDSVVGTLMRNVYLWMTLALVITGLTALVTARSQALTTLLFANSWAWILLFVAELALVVVLSARINSMAFSTATLIFILYSIINGITFSVIFLAYSLPSIATTFFITAGMFGGMAIYGSITKKDLGAFGKFGLMALIGLIIAGIVNIFVASSAFDFIISAIGVIVFAGLTAYDSQKIQQLLLTADEVNESTQKIALLGSLTLYLDFINIFLYLLRLFGKRN